MVYKPLLSEDRYFRGATGGVLVQRGDVRDGEYYRVVTDTLGIWYAA